MALQSENQFVFVENSFLLSNGILIAFLKCFDGELKEGTTLKDLSTDDTWFVGKKVFTTGSIESYRLREQRESQNIFEYFLTNKDNKKPSEKIYLKISS